MLKLIKMSIKEDISNIIWLFRVKTIPLQYNLKLIHYEY